MLPVGSSLAPKQKAAIDVPMSAIYVYAGFGLVAFFVYHTVADREASSVLTMSALAQCLGIVMLCIQSVGSGKAVGISAASLLLDGAAICLRLSSTLWLDGYLPTDRTGDFLYQAFDVCSLLLIAFLLRQVLVVQRDSYQECDDTFRVGPSLLVCLVLGALLHGDMDEVAAFDSLWLAGLFTSVVAVLPQFWLITRSGGWTGAMTSHYIAAMALSRFLSGCFMWMGRAHITCQPYFAGVEHTIISIFIAHFVHIILLADFGYLYTRSVLKRGLCEPVALTTEMCCVAQGPVAYSLDTEKVCEELEQNGATDWYSADAETESLLMEKLASINCIDDVKLRAETLEGALKAAMQGNRGNAGIDGSMQQYI